MVTDCVLAEKPPTVAVICAEPTPMALARPPAETETTVGLPVVKMAEEVRSRVVPSE